VQWTVVVPVKALPAAKSRLASTVRDSRTHDQLVRAIRADTLAAAAHAEGVARILVVADVDGVEAVEAAEVIVQGEPGLNAGLREAAAYAAARWPGDGVAALVADLPALQPEHLGEALRLAAGADAAFVADSSGEGTTLLTARPGTALAPSFGAGSALRHAQHALSVVGAPGLRQDVDTESDLFRALELGSGPMTRAAAAAVTSCSR
jgi:2-phospho-L-lactate guanylyltransferase